MLQIFIDSLISCIRKGQLEETSSWKVLIWKVRYKIGKNEVGNLQLEFKRRLQLSKLIFTFQLQQELSNYRETFKLQRNFPI